MPTTRGWKRKTAVDRPLAGARGVDAIRGSLATTTSYLAELGARVDCIIPEGSGEALPERIANLGKVRWDSDCQAPERDLLLANADIIVEDVGSSGSQGNTAQVFVSLSPFGRGDAFSGWQAAFVALQSCYFALRTGSDRLRRVGRRDTGARFRRRYRR